MTENTISRLSDIIAVNRFYDENQENTNLLEVEFAITKVQEMLTGEKAREKITKKELILIENIVDINNNAIALEEYLYDIKSNIKKLECYLDILLSKKIIVVEKFKDSLDV